MLSKGMNQQQFGVRGGMMLPRDAAPVAQSERPTIAKPQVERPETRGQMVRGMAQQMHETRFAQAGGPGRPFSQAQGPRTLPAGAEAAVDKAREHYAHIKGSVAGEHVRNEAERKERLEKLQARMQDAEKFQTTGHEKAFELFKNARDLLDRQQGQGPAPRPQAPPLNILVPEPAILVKPQIDPAILGKPQIDPAILVKPQPEPAVLIKAQIDPPVFVKLPPVSVDIKQAPPVSIETLGPITAETLA